MHFQTKTILLLLCLAASLVAQAQYLVLEVGSPKYIAIREELPKTLTNERSLVIISVPTEKTGMYDQRGNWKKLAREVHGYFRQIGIDAIAYFYIDDLNAGPEVKSVYLSLFEKRNVKNIISVKLDDSGYEIIVTAFDAKDYLKNGQPGWHTTSPDLETGMVRLGRQILRQEMEQSNYLIPEQPEYVQDLKIIKGTRYENFPSRLQSQKLAVVTFPKVPTDHISDPELLRNVEAYNTQVDQKNALLEQIMENYPFKYEMVTYTDEEQLYKGGYQYALIPLSSSAQTLHNLLDYPKEKGVKHYVSHGMDNAMNHMPVHANATKYYIKQTIVKDVHTGDEWDADVTWDLALRNFIYNLRVAFKKNG